MTQINISDKAMMVKVPEGISEWEIFEIDKKNYLNGEGNWEMFYGTQPLPPGNWQYLCLASEMTEERAKGVMPELYLGDTPVGKYENYGFGMPKFKTALESFHSFMRANNLEGEWAVLVKNEGTTSNLKH